MHCMYCMYVHVWYVLAQASMDSECICVCIFLYSVCNFFQSICACIVCVVCMCMYAACMVCIGPSKHGCQHVPKRPPAGEAPSGPHSGHPWAGGQPSFSRHRRPSPGPIFAHPRAQHALGGPKCTPCAANRQSTRISRSASPP